MSLDEGANDSERMVGGEMEVESQFRDDGRGEVGPRVCGMSDSFDGSRGRY